MNIIISSLDAKIVFPNGDPSTEIDIDSIKVWIDKELD